MYEHGNEYVGTVFVLPETRSFELRTMVHGEAAIVTGTISQQLAARFADGAADPIDPRQVALQPRRVEVMTREIHERHRAPRKVYCLTRLFDFDTAPQGNRTPAMA
ncbi:hypothetical protein LK542_16230 [Massilia sp. IC2-477]|uniref:hypothetical protein n=1 Tax=unclassified Massilia TaxID=2609279 RepID=UPI001D125B09|nr:MULTISPECIES: hypothetical protein [unclassified Massilia]MCC2957165.1 hypothetical protein [Massilia sp. IC2-477]MCC2970974.1 hypothetical protein [Massilia sp. IC2-476]